MLNGFSRNDDSRNVNAELLHLTTDSDVEQMISTVTNHTSTNHFEYDHPLILVASDSPVSYHWEAGSMFEQVAHAVCASVASARPLRSRGSTSPS